MCSAKLLRSLPLTVLFCCLVCRVAFPADDAPVQTHGNITLYRHAMGIRFSVPAQILRPQILVIYATGDGGWGGVDDRLFGWIASSGWPIAGFSSKNYLKNLRYVSKTDTTTPQGLARDYGQVIAYAKSRLNLPEETPVLLVGNSRGAGLSVVAAGEGELKQHLAGVIAVALTREEEHVLHSHGIRRSAREREENRKSIEIQNYDYLPRLASYPVCVLQSTGDHYLPAAFARELFGPDGEFRRFRPIEARNHSFRGGGESLHDELLSALSWVAGLVNHPTASRR